jgi:putative PIN family toxin of toxin-antitoxin system
LRVVLDTNVLIRAHGRRQSIARELLVRLLERSHTVVLSNEIIVEVTKVLRYPKFQSLYRMAESDLLEYSQFLQDVAEMIVLDSRYLAPLRDANDLAVLQTADRGQADILCTNDGDFYDSAVISFCEARGIGVCDEVSLLAGLF